MSMVRLVVKPALTTRANRRNLVKEVTIESIVVKSYAYPDDMPDLEDMTDDEMSCSEDEYEGDIIPPPRPSEEDDITPPVEGDIIPPPRPAIVRGSIGAVSF